MIAADLVVALGCALILGMLAFTLRRETLAVSADDEGLHCGPRSVPWTTVQDLAYVRGGYGATFRVATRHGVLVFRDEQVEGHPDRLRDRIVGAAGLVPAPVEHVPAGQPILPGDLLQTFARPESLVPAEDGDRPPAGGTSTAARRGMGLAALLTLLATASKLVKVLNLGAVLPTAASMGLTIWAYAQIWGASFAAGFVGLVLVHELGHAAVMSAKGLRTSPIVFIPFVGALIAVKDQFRDALVESETAWGGPAAGALAATACFVGWRLTGQEFLLHLGTLGFLLNLFNLLPLSPLDGGRIVTAVSPLLWLPGIVIGAALAWRLGHPMLWILVILGALRAWRTFRPPAQQVARRWGGSGAARSPDPAAWREVAPRHRVLMALAYFGLCAYLAAMTGLSMELGGPPRP